MLPFKTYKIENIIHSLKIQITQQLYSTYKPLNKCYIIKHLATSLASRGSVFEGVGIAKTA